MLNNNKTLDSTEKCFTCETLMMTFLDVIPDVPEEHWECLECEHAKKCFRLETYKATVCLKCTPELISLIKKAYPKEFEEWKRKTVQD